MYEVRNYTHYRENALEHKPGQAAAIAQYVQQVGVKIGRNVFTSLHNVNPADLHNPDILHNIYLGLFKHMMQWVEGFLKKHIRQQGFDNAWKEIPPYPRFRVPQKGYWEVTQWQGKEMGNLSPCISAVLASALRNPDSSQHQDFQHALKSISALVDFSLMAQYRSHASDTLAYMAMYLMTFHQTKDVFLEFRTSKAIRTEANRQDREQRELMASQHAKEVHHNTAAKSRQQADQDRLQRFNQRADLIRQENHVNFIKMHYLSQDSAHVRRFAAIPMYSTEIGELAHKKQIKEGYPRSNKNEAAHQILLHYGSQHALGMRLQTLETLLKAESVIMIDNSGGEVGAVRRSIPRPVLKGQMRNIGTLTKLCRTCSIDYGDVIEEMLHFIKRTVADDLPLPTDPTELGFLPVEQFTHLEIPVTDFQETDVFQIHGVRCTGTKAFCNCGPRINWVWIQAGGEESYGDLRGREVANLVGLFKIRNILIEDIGVRRLAFLSVLDPINVGRLHLASSHIQVGKRTSGRDMRIVDIGTVIGQAHLIPSRERQWIVNHRIDLLTFNEIY